MSFGVIRPPAASGGQTLITQGSVSSAVASIEITNIPTTYQEVIVEFEVLRLSANGRVHLQYGLNGSYTNTSGVRGITQILGKTNFGVDNRYLSTSTDASTVGTSDGICINDIYKGYSQHIGQNSFGYVKILNWNGSYSRSPIEYYMRYSEGGSTTEITAITHAFVYLNTPNQLKIFSPQANISNVEYKIYGVS